MHTRQALIEQRLGLRCHFGGSAPKAPAPPLPPSPVDAAAKIASEPVGRKRANYQSTILTDGLGVGNQTSAKKTLLAQ